MLFSKWICHDPVFEIDDIEMQLRFRPCSGHRLFAYDLMCNVKPKRIVDLSIQENTSLFPILQAAKDANLDTQVMAIRRSNACGNGEDFKTGNLGELIRSLLCSFQKVRIGFLFMQSSEAAEYFSKDSVDIVLMHGCNSYEEAKADFNIWLPKLAADGLILFYDVHPRTPNGYQALWAELNKKYPAFSFGQGCGLGVLSPKGGAALNELQKMGLYRLIIRYESIAAQHLCEWAKQDKGFERHKSKLAENRLELPPVFLFGAQRSGTNMSVWCLEKSTELVLYNENNDWAFHEFKLRDESVIRELLRIGYPEEVKTLLFKSITDTHRCSEIHNWFEDGKSLFIVRFPDQVVSSNIKAFGKKGYDVLKRVFRNLSEKRHPIFKALNISERDKIDIYESILEYYHAKMSHKELAYLLWIVQNKFYFANRLNRAKNVKLLIYEEILRNPKKEIENIANFIGISCNGDMVESINPRNLSKLTGRNASSPMIRNCYALYDQFYDLYESKN